MATWWMSMTGMIRSSLSRVPGHYSRSRPRSRPGKMRRPPLCPGVYFKPELYSVNEKGTEEELRGVAKLRHIAIQVPDLETAARFYENALELTRVAEAESPIGNAIMLSDGG